MRDVITGKKIMALAISEPYAGSDVSGLRTTAVRDGDHFIVNGYAPFFLNDTPALLRYLSKILRVLICVQREKIHYFRY